MKKKLIILIMSFLMITSLVKAQTELKAVVGSALPPYIIPESDKGIEADIVRQALQYSNYSVKFTYVPFARVDDSIKNKDADCALTLNEASGVTGVYYSDSHITYQNVAVALKSKGLKITSIADLKTYRVEAFQDATKYLGPDFAAVVKSNANYAEIADQKSQVKLLFANRVDILIMDINIFKYFRQKINDADVSEEVVYYSLFPLTYYKVAFTSKEVCDKFNAGLKKLKESGKYTEIFKSYIK